MTTTLNENVLPHHLNAGIVIEFEVPGLSRESYETINDEAFAPALPEGLRSHVAWEGETGWRIVEVWDSRGSWERFVGARLGPVLAKHRAPEPAIRFGSLARAYGSPTGV